MSVSPCAASLKNAIPIKDFKSPKFKCNLNFQQKEITSSRLSPSYRPTPYQLSPNVPAKSPSLFLDTSPITLPVASCRKFNFVSQTKFLLANSKPLGRGRFGRVFLARYEGRNVAVKIAKNSAKWSPNEMTLLHLSHPNIIQIYKVEFVDQDILILMEPWGTLNLQQFMCLHSKISWNDVISYAKQLASALNYCHTNEILHLDVKPANVMINDNKWIKLGDFGNSLTYDQIETESVQPRIGTVAYCAPEMLQGEQPTWHCDVYSYGITLWQLDHNQQPFQDLSWPTIAYLVVAKNKRPAIRDNLSAPENQLVTLYKECWDAEKSRRRRFFEIVDILETLSCSHYSKCI